MFLKLFVFSTRISNVLDSSDKKRKKKMKSLRLRSWSLLVNNKKTQKIKKNFLAITTKQQLQSYEL